MRIHLTYVQGSVLRDYENAYVPMFSEELRHFGGCSKFTIEPDPSRADIIILWEGFESKNLDYIRLLESNPLIRNHAERVYCINYEDHPEGLLAGIYTSLENPFFNASIHRIRPFFLMNNPLVYDLDHYHIMKPVVAKWLFSFTGAASHEVRKKIFSLFSDPSPQYYVRHIHKWYNHNEDDRRQFLNIALDSVFCLCPHGFCAYTPRITEVMAMARVPVIIADDWIPFSFEEKVPYYIKVAEQDIGHLPDILSERRADADEYRHNARTLWEKYCSIKSRVVTGVECISELAARGCMSFAAYRELWRSNAFLRMAGWTRRQQFALRMEQHARRWFPNAKLPGVSHLTRYRNTRM